MIQICDWNENDFLEFSHIAVDYRNGSNKSREWKKNIQNYRISDRKFSTRYLSLTKCSLSMTHLSQLHASCFSKSHHHKNNAQSNRYLKIDEQWSSVCVCALAPSAQCRYLLNDVIYMNEKPTPDLKNLFRSNFNRISFWTEDEEGTKNQLTQIDYFVKCITLI